MASERERAERTMRLAVEATAAARGEAASRRRQRRETGEAAEVPGTARPRRNGAVAAGGAPPPPAMMARHPAPEPPPAVVRFVRTIPPPPFSLQAAARQFGQPCEYFPVLPPIYYVPSQPAPAPAIGPGRPADSCLSSSLGRSWSAQMPPAPLQPRPILFSQLLSGDESVTDDNFQLMDHRAASMRRSGAGGGL